MANASDTRTDECAVKIAVRERPTRDYPGLEIEEPSVVHYHERSANILIVDERPFTFDHVLGPTATQQQIFDELIKPLVYKVKQGYNCTVLAYGQTGTGKSYTMGLHTNGFESDQVGIIPRCLREILALSARNGEAADEQAIANKLEISGSFIEIYNEKVFDLLGENSSEPIIARGYKYTGGTRKAIESVEDCHSILVHGSKNRHVRPTKMNAQSSRSHAIFTIHVRTISALGVTSASLNLVDLAGSEGVRRTGHQGVAMSEGVHINQGLLSINKVLQAKAMGNKVIPYRDSVLSFVLQDSFNANSYLTLLACISPHRADLSETLSTLRFAQRSKQLKHTPLINSILAGLKKNKTPRKHSVTPMKRSAVQAGLNSLSKTGKSSYHSNTFCTPSKIKRLNVSDKLNRTEMGLTPKEKKKTQMGIVCPTITKPTGTTMPNAALITNQALAYNRESLFNSTIDSRASLMSLNMSSSTTVDGNAGSRIISFSPIVRKCMSEIENVMENKISQLVETLKDINKENSNKHPMLAESTPYATPWSNTAGSLPLNLRQELKSIIKEVLTDNTSQLKITAQHNVNETASSLFSTETPPMKENIKCQLFATSSPVFKIPVVPEDDKRAKDSVRVTDAMYVDMSITNCDISIDTSQTETDQTVHRKPALRRSRRISTSQQNETNVDLQESLIANKSLRRSRRLSALMQQCPDTNDVHANISSTSVSTATDENVVLPKPRRRSARKSLIDYHNERRRNIRLAAHKEEPEPDTSEDSVPKPNQKSKKSRATALDNSVIAGYFSDKPQAATENPKSNAALSKHRKAILDLLNTGSMRELQLLPQIGQKTAFQLVTQRTLYGKFKNLKQIEKLPIWRGHSWERFAQANMLID